MPTANGCAVFMGTDSKTFVMHIDPNMGLVISLNLQHIHKERPLTHDLIQSIFMGLGIHLEHIAINDINKSTFFARIILTMKNELGTKLIEIDARPSDSIVLALQAHKPIFTTKEILEKVEDVTDIFNKIMEEGGSCGGVIPENKE